MKDICLISPKFCGYIGGMETHGYEFAKFFATDPITPIRTIFTKEKIEDGVPVGTTIQDGNTINISHSPDWANSYINAILTGDFRKDTELIISKSNFPETILYLNSPTWAPVCEFIKERFPTTKTIIRSGGNDIVAGWIGNEKDITKSLEESRQYLVSIINNSVDYFIVNSEYSYNRTVTAGVNPLKIVKILGGVDCNLFFPTHYNHNNHITLITSARLVNFKGIEYSIEAFKKASLMTDTKLKYLIIGDGPERKKLEEKAFRCSNDIEFIGAKTVEEVPAYLQSADIFLHMPFHELRKERGSSYIHTETMGRSLCEAAATGLPTIATRVGGITEVIKDGETGFIIPEYDIDSAAEKIVNLVNNADLRKHIGEQARLNAIKEFDWLKIFNKYHELFK